MEQENKPITFDDAKQIDPGNVKPGLRVKGTIAPFGGRWIQDDPAVEEIRLMADDETYPKP